jgi:hypothetical protein
MHVKLCWRNQHHVQSFDEKTAGFSICSVKTLDFAAFIKLSVLSVQFYNNS